MMGHFLELTEQKPKRKTTTLFNILDIEYTYQFSIEGGWVWNPTSPPPRHCGTEKSMVLRGLMPTFSEERTSLDKQEE